MITIKSIILKDSNDVRVKPFFKKILDEFGEELIKLAELIYSYPNNEKGIDGLKSINDVFALIERTYVGVLNNAIIRSYSEAVTLQEFSVYNEHKASGRADLFVSVPDTEGTLDFLFEAKVDTTRWKKYSNEQTLKEYQEIYNQAHAYYSDEEKYYSQKPHIVSIIFEWVRHKDLLDEILKEEDEDDCTDFYYIYHYRKCRATCVRFLLRFNYSC
jgi:hypothetical protein